MRRHSTWKGEGRAAQHSASLGLGGERERIVVAGYGVALRIYELKAKTRRAYCQ